MPRKRKAGRPKGSKNKIKTIDNANGSPIQPTGKRKRGRPAGIPLKKRGRPIGWKKSSAGNHSLLTTGIVQGIHFIGKTLIIDTNTMNVDEVIFLGEGKQPKVR